MCQTVRVSPPPEQELTGQPPCADMRDMLTQGWWPLGSLAQTLPLPDQDNPPPCFYLSAITHVLGQEGDQCVGPMLQNPKALPIVPVQLPTGLAACC